MDFTYVQSEIQSNPVWALAFRFSEAHNDDAPLGWTRYIGLASWMLNVWLPEQQAGTTLAPHPIDPEK